MDHSHGIEIFCSLSNFTKINNSPDPAWPPSYTMSLISFTTRLIKCLSYSLPLIPFFHSPLNPFQEGFCPQHSNEIVCQSHWWPPHCWTRQSILSSHPPQAAFTRVNQFLILESFLCLISGSKLSLAFSSIALTSPFLFPDPSVFLFPKPLLQNFIILNLHFGLWWFLHSTGTDRGHLMPFSWWLI